MVELKQRTRTYYPLAVTYEKHFHEVSTDKDDVARSGVEWEVTVNGKIAACGFCRNKPDAELEADHYVYCIIRDETMGPGPYVRER